MSGIDFDAAADAAFEAAVAFDEWLDSVNEAIREITPDMALADWCDCNDDAVREFYPLEPSEVVACLRDENPEFRRACRRVEAETAIDNAAHE